MFDKVYEIAVKSNSLDELKKNLKKAHIDKAALDALTVKDGALVHAAGQLAREGQNEKVDWLWQCDASADYIAYGYALNGNNDLAQQYHEHCGAGMEFVVQGFAQAGREDLVKQAYEACTDPNSHRKLTEGIILGYALAGSKAAWDYAATPGEENIAVFGYTLGGHSERIEAFLKTDNKRNVIVAAYAVRGDFKRVEELRKQYPKDVAVAAILEGCRMACNNEMRKKYDINFLLNSYLSKRGARVDSTDKTKEYLSRVPAFFQKSYQQKKAAVNALKDALGGQNVDLSKHVSTLRNGTLGADLRALVKLGVGSALVGKEVNTVREFVQALQEKNAPKPQPV